MGKHTDVLPCTYEYHMQNRWAEYDGYGIFLAYVCPKCERRKMEGFRPDIRSRYEADEAIDDY